MGTNVQWYFQPQGSKELVIKQMQHDERIGPAHSFGIGNRWPLSLSFTELGVPSWDHPDPTARHKFTVEDWKESNILSVSTTIRQWFPLTEEDKKDKDSPYVLRMIEKTTIVENLEKWLVEKGYAVPGLIIRGTDYNELHHCYDNLTPELVEDYTRRHYA